MGMIIAPHLIGALGEYGIHNAAMLSGGYVSWVPPTSTASVRTLTFSGWRQRGELSQMHIIFEASMPGFSPDKIEFTAADKIRVRLESGGDMSTVALFRDPAAFMHICVIIDLSNATVADRVKVYVNNVRQTLSGTTFTDANFVNFKTNTNIHRLHDSVIDPGSYDFKGYAANDIVTEGQYAASDFAEVSAVTGNWVAKKQVVTYGTNGFFLDYAKDNGGTPSLGDDLGTDASGNGNHFTVNGTVIQVTSTPTNVYATLNPLVSGSYTFNLSNGNLTTGATSAVDLAGRCASLMPDSGKWYWEIVLQRGVMYPYIGVTQQGSISHNTTSGCYFTLAYRPAGGVLASSGTALGTITTTSTGVTTANDNDIVQFALDLDNDKLWIGVNGVWFNSGSPSSGINEQFSWTTHKAISPMISDYNSEAFGTTFAFSDADFTYTPPTGFKSLCTDNLPAMVATDKNVNNHFKTVLYTGDGVAIGSGGQVIDTGLPQVDFAWIKGRDTLYYHRVFDTARGAAKQVPTNATDAEATTTEELQTFSGSTFTLGLFVGVNELNKEYAAWCASLPNSKTSGWTGSPTITPSKEIYNTDLGMSVVTYTGNGSLNQTIPCEMLNILGQKAAFIIIKDRDSTTNWPVYHKDMTDDYNCYLNGTWAQSPDGHYDTSLNTTGGLVGIASGDVSATNINTNTYVAYVFAESDFIKIGSYVGNGSADGPMVNAGISPEWWMVKSTGVENWLINDAARPGYNPTGDYLFANLSNAEGGAGTEYVDLVSNGVKARTTGASANSTGVTYTYIMIGQPTGAKNANEATAR